MNHNTSVMCETMGCLNGVQQQDSMISGFRCKVNEIRALLGYYTAYGGNS